MAQATVVFDDFSGGEYGLLGSRAAGKRGGMFTAKNMRVYRNGWIGPRGGLKAMSVSGLPAGTMWGLAYAPFSSKELFIVVGANVYLAPLANVAAASYVGTLGGTPTEIIHVNESTRRLVNRLYFTVYGVATYYVDMSALTLNTVAGVGGCRALELYGDRLFAGGASSAAELVAYSDAADFNTWGGLSFFSVGYEFSVFHMFTQRGNLTILAQALLWRFSGTPGGLSAVLRQASSAVPAAEGGAVMDGDVAVYIPGARTAPVVYDGGIADERRLAHLEWSTRSFDFGAAVARGNNDVLFVSGGGDNRGLLRSNGVWSFHTFGVTIGANITRVDTDRFIVASTASTPVLHSIDMSLDRPGFTSDSWSSPGDASTTPFDAYLHLPEWWDPEGREVTVRSVIVDFTKWRTGSGSTNHFDLTVRALNRYQASGPNTSTAQSFDEDGTSATAGETGDEDRRVFGFGDQGSGGGFEIRLDAVRGVAIRAVTVVLDVEETRAP